MVNTSILKLLLVGMEEEGYLALQASLADAVIGNLQFDWRESFENALEAINEGGAYNAVFVDASIQIDRALGFIRQIIAAGYPNPLILLAGEDNYDLDLAAMRAGASGFLVKNEVTQQRLERTIRYALVRDSRGKAGENQWPASFEAAAQDSIRPPLDLSQGEPEAFSNSLPEKSQTEDNFRITQSRLTSILNSGVIGIVITGEDGLVHEANDYFLRLVGLTNNDLDAHRILLNELTPPEYLPADYHAKRELIQCGVCTPYEKEFLCKDGGRVWVIVSNAVLPDEQGTVVSFIQDVQDRKRAELALQESEERFRILADSMPQLVWTAEPEGTVDYYNKRWNEYRGIEPGKNGEWLWAPVVHEEDLQKTVDAWTGALETGQTYQVEHRICMRDNSFRWHLSRGVPVRNSSGKITKWYGTATDIHEQKKAELALADVNTRLIESEERYRLAARATNDAIWDWDFESNHIRWNEALEELFGYVPSGDQNIDWWISHVHPDDRDRVHDHIFSAISSNREHWTEEYQFLCATGEYAVVYDRGWVVRDRHGRPVRMVGAMMDMTERKRVEEALREREAQLQKLVTTVERSNQDLEHFAFMASHDLQEPLRKVIAFGTRLSESLQDRMTDEERDFLDRMQRASARMQEMINDLLRLSRVTTKGQEFIEVDLREVVKEVISDLEIQVRKNEGTVTIGVLPTIQADPMQIHLLFQNLIGNALKFHRSDVSPEIKVWAKEDGEFVRIYVQDNGIGFNDQLNDKIFQPFTRLHGMSAYEGSGMGLAICRKIVERHQGRIYAQSEDGKGSTFIVELPASQAEQRDSFYSGTVASMRVPSPGEDV